MRALILTTVVMLAVGCGNDQGAPDEDKTPAPGDTQQVEIDETEGPQVDSSSIPSWVPVEAISEVLPEPLAARTRPDSGLAQTEPSFEKLDAALAELREEYAALRTGEFVVLTADEERRIFVFSRTLDRETLIVALSRSDEAHSIRVELQEALRKRYETIYSTHDEGYRVQQDATALLLEMNEHSALVLRGME